MPTLPHWLLLHFFATAALTGLIWTVQLAIYPRFADLPAAVFPGYHLRYCWGIGMVVGPLILLEVATGIVWVAMAPEKTAAFVGLLLIGVPLFSTAFLQAPLHLSLMSGRKDAEINRLIRTNWLRTAAWSGRAVLVGLALAGFFRD